MKTETYTKMDPFESVTNSILEALDRGVIPWKMPWNKIAGGMPCNLSTGKDYQGSNIWVLMAQGYNSKYWITFKQARTLKGAVKKGEKGTRIIIFKPVPAKTDAAGDVTRKGFGFFSTAVVFNIDQCKDLIDPAPPFIGPLKPFESLAKAEKLAAGYIGAPVVTYGGNRACYAPGLDTINMPEKTSFHSAGGFYASLFHEYSHSTGHAKRLDRPEITGAVSFGSGDYSREELVAEMGSAFLCAEAGIDNTLENAAAYIASWRRKLQDPENKKWVAEAGGKAKLAVEYIKGNLKKS